MEDRGLLGHVSGHDVDRYVLATIATSMDPLRSKAAPRVATCRTDSVTMDWHHLSCIAREPWTMEQLKWARLLEVAKRRV